MESDIQLMHKVWDLVKIEETQPERYPKVNFDEIVSSIFTTGPFYYYIIDFTDMSISHLSGGFEIAHGLPVERATSINDILGLIHPEDAEFVLKAEEKALNFIMNNIGTDKFTRYKGSYNFRMKTSGGSYQLFNHQALSLLMDENFKIVKSLNIHTNISHITEENNYKFSLIGLAGEPSYLNLKVYHKKKAKIPEPVFTRRELEIIKLIAEGHSAKSIAERFYISPATAETHRKNILRKSGCKNSVNLIARSMSEGWI